MMTSWTHTDYFTRGIYALARVHTFLKQESLIMKYWAGPGVTETVPSPVAFFIIYSFILPSTPHLRDKPHK